VPHREAAALVGERDRGEQRRRGRLRAPPRGAVVVGEDDVAAIADGDDALAGPLGVDQQQARERRRGERPRFRKDILRVDENRRRRGDGGGDYPGSERVPQRVPTPRRLFGV
jgi:hypothetical protein